MNYNFMGLVFQLKHHSIVLQMDEWEQLRNVHLAAL